MPMGLAPDFCFAMLSACGICFSRAANGALGFEESHLAASRTRARMPLIGGCDTCAPGLPDWRA